MVAPRTTHRAGYSSKKRPAAQLTPEASPFSRIYMSCTKDGRCEINAWCKVQNKRVHITTFHKRQLGPQYADYGKKLKELMETRGWTKHEALLWVGKDVD